MKIVINTRHGGYQLSEMAYRELGLEWDGYGTAYYQDRTDGKLVAAVEKLGAAASGNFSRLEVIEIPDGTIWHIDDYDGMEWVAEQHREWHGHENQEEI